MNLQQLIEKQRKRWVIEDPRAQEFIDGMIDYVRQISKETAQAMAEAVRLEEIDVKDYWRIDRKYHALGLNQAKREVDERIKRFMEGV